MSNQKASQAAQSNQAAWKQLALDLNQPLPRAGAHVATNSLPRDPTLTQKFNRAAKQPELSTVVTRPVTKKQIEAMGRKMSQLRPTLEFGTMGSVNNARNPERDRSLEQTMAALQGRLDANKGLKNDFALAAKKGLTKQQFNRASQGMGR